MLQRKDIVKWRSCDIGYTLAKECVEPATDKVENKPNCDNATETDIMYGR